MKIKTIARELKNADVRFISLVSRGANRIPFRILKKSSEGESQMIDLTTLRPVLKGEKIQAPTKKAANLPGFAQILGASVSRDIGTPAPAVPVAPAKPVQPLQSIAASTRDTHAPASGGKPTRQAFNTPKQPASTLPAASRDKPVTYASLQAAIDAAMSKQRDEAKAAAFNQSRSAFSRIHKSTAPDARSGTGNAHALRNLGGRMAAAILGGTARKDEGHSLPHNTGFRAVSGASLKG
ncbi:MAG: hypothetical protein I8H71_05550 [Xanthomonadaceae bacterium]|nr:hypothetical protein [Xanthomonadaceae bacterium]